jgi:hypothetical protein
MVVVVTETGVLSITGAKPGRGRSVLIGSDVVGGPLPVIFDGVIVNVYSVSCVRPVKVTNVSLVVYVSETGKDTIE